MPKQQDKEHSKDNLNNDLDDLELMDVQANEQMEQ